MRLLQSMREVLPLRRYILKTGKAYLHRVRRSVSFDDRDSEASNVRIGQFKCNNERTLMAARCSKKC
jgi:hypothetical protein